ncbi:MAG: transcriptional regulator [Gammaproteobacteria bacterium]|nr:transcriptional regulator [Gammaproteobacteria bacterium]
MFAELTLVAAVYAEELSRLVNACYMPVSDDAELDRRMRIIDELFECAETEDDIAAMFANLVAERVYEYEQERLVIPAVKPGEALKFFMKDRGVKQKDLADIAPQSVISEILREKRNMTVAHVKGFSKFFGVPEKTFFG